MHCHMEFVYTNLCYCIEYKKKLQITLKRINFFFFLLISNSKLGFVINVVNIGLWVNSKLKFLLLVSSTEPARQNCFAM